MEINMNAAIAWLAEVLGILRGREEALRIQGYWGEADHLKRLIEAAPTDAAPQAATGTVPPESSAPAVAAPHAHRCMSCGARWYCPHQPGNCKADENVLPSLVLPGPDGQTVFHHVCRNKPQPSAKQDTSPLVSHTDGDK